MLGWPSGKTGRASPLAGGNQLLGEVERTTRFLVLFHLPAGRDAQSVAEALRQFVAAMPAGVFRSIAWDQGREMAHHTQFTADTGIPVFFCDPHTPWQRGRKQNTNGLVRQYPPKGTDLSNQSVEDLRRIARSTSTAVRARSSDT